MKPAVLSVIGRKGSGKADVIEGLIAFLKSRGLRTGLIKHLAKEGAEIDQPGKDTYRYRRSGAETVMISGRKQLAIFSELREEVSVEKLLPLFEDFDLVLLEGYYQEAFPRIEVHRAETGEPLGAGSAGPVIAIYSDRRQSLPGCFAAEDPGALFSWIEDWVRKTCESGMEAVHE